MLLIIDNYDSFTYTLLDYFQQLGMQCEVKKNDDPTLISSSQHYTACVLSPGPSRPKDAGYLMQYLEINYDKLPILGVCLGHQAIGEFFEMNLNLAQTPMHGRVSKLTLTHPSCIFNNLQSGVKVMRYHSLVLDNKINENMVITAVSENDEVMSIQHKTLPIFGVQFHPESVLTTYGMLMLRNFLEHIEKN